MQTRLFEPSEIAGLSDRPTGSSEATPDAPLHSDGWKGPLEACQDEAVAASTCTGAANRTSPDWIRNGQGVIAFSNLVRESSGFHVIPIDWNSKADLDLLNHLSRALNAFVKLTERSGQRYRGNRINDIGKRFEYMVVEELKKTPLSVTMLGRPGYPDCMLRQGERITYLEIKTTGTIQTKSNIHLPSFSLSSCKKIESDARHLLLKVQFEEEENKIWKVVAWELRDLSLLKTRLKTEFNAGCADFADIQLLGSSDDGTRGLKMVGQSVLDKPRMGMPHPSRRPKARLLNRTL